MRFIKYVGLECNKNNAEDWKGEMVCIDVKVDYNKLKLNLKKYNKKCTLENINIQLQ